MQKLNIKLISLLSLSILAALFLKLAENHSMENELHEDEDPGFADFYRLTRQNAEGIIPEGIHRSWYLEDKKNFSLKKGFFNLENPAHFGPDSIGGRTRTILIDKVNPGRLFAGAVSGGLWRSDDAGANWIPIDDFAPSLAVTGITQSPFNPDLLYYSTGEVEGSNRINGIGVYRSVDHGNTFEILDGTEGGIFDETYDIEHSLTMDSTIYVATNGAGLRRSTDGGKTFELIFNTINNVFEIEVFDDTTIMIGVYSEGIYQIHERTLESTVLKNGFSSNGFGRLSFTHCKNHPNVLYAITVSPVLSVGGTEFRDIYKSSNRGKTWVSITQPDTIRFSQAWFDLKIGVAPWDSNLVILGGIEAVYSLNGGLTWNNLGTGTQGENRLHVDHHEFIFYEKDSFLCGNDGGVYRFKLPDLRNAINLNHSYNVTQFYAGFYGPSNNHMIAGSQDNNTLTNVIGKNHFRVVLGGDGAYCAIHQQDDDYIYASSQNFGLRRIFLPTGDVDRIDRTIKLQVSSQSLWFIHPFEMNTLDGDQLYVTTKEGSYRSGNKGSSWSLLTENLLGESYCVGLSNDMDPVVYIGGTVSHMYRINNGTTAGPGDEVWLTKKTPIPFKGSLISCIKVDPTDRNTVYVGMTTISNNPRIWKVTETDQEEPVFTPIHSNLPVGLPVSSIEVDPENPEFIMIATDYGMYTSNNGGGWWEKEERIPNVMIGQLRLRHSDRKLFIFTYGRGAWTMDLKDNPKGSTVPFQLARLNVYPNPARDQIKVEGVEVENIQLYNLKGELIIEESAATLNTNGVAAGVYFIYIESKDGKRITKKVVIH